MASYTLTGSGVQALTPGTAALYLQATTLDPVVGMGRATPANLFGLGMVRAGNPYGFAPMVPLDCADFWFILPAGTTRLGYTILADSEVTATEL